MMLLQDGYSNDQGAPATLDHFSSQRDVVYSCGSCGYELNLNSSNRNTTNLGSKYKKSIKKGVVSFYSVDESRFSQTDELKCLPYFTSKNSWGLFRRRTKLLCRKCGNYIGSCYEESSSPIVSDNSDSSSGNGVGGSKKYNIRISALQPFSDVSGAPLFTS
ncbi:uncharacterized protein At4g08330, chloroplastic-like [Asparagus officinalis]|uniref:uncharacterized protein At4g08330, chloroplastic-like n=1 Tax=Asparagus officinalis TaxID=4686 RepID=UPI00098E350E|nr:uncharacterized protein At4g08330, chloroplastic-like [Asparagus officinalis]